MESQVETMGYAVKRLQQALRARMDAVLAPHGLTMPQYAVLVLLAEQPGISSAELARRSFVTAPTMIRIVTTLEGNGLLTRVEHPPEGRARVAQLSAEGERRLRAAAQDVQTVERVLQDAAAERDRRTVLAWLAAAAEHLEARRTAQEAGPVRLAGSSEQSPHIPPPSSR
jgi:DNA-binding MarR family transcriptional regulator